MNNEKLTRNQVGQIRTVLQKTTDRRVYRRATALLALHEGLPPGQVAKLLGISRQTVYNWIDSYTRGEELSLADSPRPGRPRLWSGEFQALLLDTVGCAPEKFGYTVTHWTASLLRNHFAATHNVRISAEAIRRNLHLLGYQWRSNRYVSRQNL